jgi:hypothetical protein
MTEGLDRLLATIDELALRVVTLEQLSTVLWGLALRPVNDSELAKLLEDLRQSMRTDAESTADALHAEAAVARLLNAIETFARSPTGGVH